ncbi:MAG TPA: ribulose-phosphate 3-epimerase [Prolixibacteraceae bacterium]|nr:ribulose-phosphate 3-epimerase [Prolixibacteraceae bacterium]
MNTKRYIAPSVLSADFLNLGKDIERINRSEARFIHYDVMDGVFVPNISFGISILNQIHSVAEKPLDVHLMIKDPNPFIVPFCEAGAANITVHMETCPHLNRTIQHIKEQGIMASVCLNPHTPVSTLDEILPLIDMVLIMSVNPGFGGQNFIETSYAKIEKLRKMIDEKGLNTLIEVDGGVNFETAGKLFRAGANVLVSGSFIFQSDDPTKCIRELLAC